MANPSPVVPSEHEVLVEFVDQINIFPNLIMILFPLHEMYLFYALTLILAQRSFRANYSLFLYVILGSRTRINGTVLVGGIIKDWLLCC
jgi:hypothetical protein